MRIRLTLLVLALVTLGMLGAQPVQPPSKPFLRIETGMHTALIRRIDTDRAGRFLVTASNDKTARVWDAQSGKLLQILRPPQGDGNEGKLYAVAISPDGSTVAVGGWTGVIGGNMPIYLLDRASGKVQRRIEGSVDVVDHLSYSLDGRYLAALFGGKSGVRIYRTSDYQETARDADYGAESYWAEFDRSGRLVTTSWDGFVRLYDKEFHLLAKRSAPGGKRPFAARFSPDGTKLAVGFQDSAAVNVLSAQDLSSPFAPDTNLAIRGNLGTVAWSTDGRVLYAAGTYRDNSAICPILSWTGAGHGAVRTWRVATSTVMDLRTVSGGRLAFGAQDPALGVIDSEGRMLWRDTPEILDYLGYQGTRENLRLSRDGTTVEFGFWAVTPQWTWNRRAARFAVTERQLSLDPSDSASLHAARTTGLNIADWKDSYNPALNGGALALDQYEFSRSLSISNDASSFVLGTEFELRFFDRQGRQQWHVPVPGAAFAVNLTNDSRYAVAALSDGTIRWYDTKNGQEVLALFAHRDGRRWVVWTPEGFFDSSKGDAASPGGEALVGYHLNRGRDHEGELIKVAQLVDLFYRPDLVAQRLKLAGAEAVRAARERIGDVGAVLAGGLPPDLELLSPAEFQSAGDYVLRLRVKNRDGGRGRIVFRVDGAELEGRAVDIPVPASDTVSRRFDLTPGRHQISATVYNGRNQLESRSVSAIVNVNQAQERPALFVVAVGISDYRDHALNQGVKYAAADAEAIAARLKEQGEGLFREVSARPLINGNATRENIRKTLADVSTRIQPSDVFVLYLAGHGTALEGEYNFVPWEVRYTSEEALREQSLNQEMVRQMLEKIPARKTLLLLDTCSSGALTGRALGISDKAAIDKLSKITGRAVLAAAASEQMALEGYEGHGVFTYAVLEALSKAIDDKGLVEVSRLADFVEDQVPEITKKRWGYEQFPMRDLKGQTFPIARKPGR